MKPDTMSDEPIKSGYKHTEAGLIPEDWEVSALGRLGSFKNGINKGKEDFGHGFPFVNLLDVFGKSKISNRSTFGLVNSTDVEKEIYGLKRGDVLFVRSSVKPEGVGLTTLVADDLLQTVYSGFLIRFRDNGQIAHELKEFCFSEPGFRNRLLSSSTVSANTNVNQDALKALQIAYPRSQEEQRAIAEALSDVDALLDALDRLIAKKRAIKQGTMQALLTGRVRLPGFTRKPGYKSTEMGLVPEDWEVKTYAELFDFLPTSSCSRSELSDSGEIYYIHYGDIHTKWNFRLDFRRHAVPRIEAHKVKGAARLRDGDLIVADASEDEEGVAKSVEVTNLGDRSAVAGLHTIALRSKGEDLVNGYKAYLQANQVVRSQVRRIASGLKVFGISKSSIGDVLVPLPHPQEQLAIAEVLSDMDAEIDSLEKRRAKLRDIKQGMMHELLTGRIRLVQPQQQAQEAHV